MAFDVAGMILLTMVTGMTSAIIAIVIYSLALPILTVVIPLLGASLFGYQAQAKYTGIFLSMVSAASIVASPISNAIYDKIGTYTPVFYAAAGISVLLIGMYLVMYRLADKQKKTP
jgi:MFS family permease